jgi:hypothetical protein
LVYASLGGELHDWSGLATIAQLIRTSKKYGGFMILTFIATHRKPAGSSSLQTPNECLSEEKSIGTCGFALSGVQTSGILRIYRSA